MNFSSKIICRTTGAIGAGIALYDAAKMGSLYSGHYGENAQSDYIERAYFNSRTNESGDFSSNAIGKTVFETRTKNPIPRIWGEVKGYTLGALQSLGNNILLVASLSFALLAKGKMAKVGGAGVILSLIYSIIHNGYGAGKHNPMN